MELDKVAVLDQWGKEQVFDGELDLGFWILEVGHRQEAPAFC